MIVELSEHASKHTNSNAPNTMVWRGSREARFQLASMEREREKGLSDKDRRDPNCNVHGFSEVSPRPANGPDLN